MDEYYPPEENGEQPASISVAPEGIDPTRSDRAMRPVEDQATVPGIPVLSNDLYPADEPRASGSRFATIGARSSNGQRLLDAGWEQAHHSARDLLRILQKRPGGVRKRVWLAGLLIVVLLVALLPPIVTVVRAAQDYQQLKALGESGIHHLLAAKDDLSGIDTSELDGFSSLLNPSPVAPNAPYSYLVGRQAGTFYNAKVTVHPSSQLRAAGIGDTTYNATVGTDTTFTMTPPAKATPTPTPSPSPTTTPYATKKSLIPDAKTLAAALGELKAAQKDFGELRSRLNDPDWILSLAGIFPGATTQLVTVRILADVGYEACGLGIEFMNAISPILGRLGDGLLASDKGILTKTDLDNLQNAVKHAQQELTDIQNRLAGVNINDLPITADQKQTFSSVLDQLPKMQNSLKQAPQYLTILGWMLGVGQSRHFLVQTLDRNELRPTGGFTGDYGVLTITDGRLEPFELKNINQLDYNGNGWIFSHRAPAPYTWWPFGNWGLRDSNLSPDYPTTAKMNMQVFHNEGGDGGIVDVDGVIQITPVAISHVLNVTGPIFVPGYNETITADNLEARIKYYQQDPAGIAKQKQLNPDDPHIYDIRKRFTQLVVRLVQDQVKKLPVSKLIPLAKQELADMRARDVQIYVTNKDIEDLLVKARASGAMDVTPGVDGYTLNQANVSVAKSTPYVKVTQTDDVTLDNSGGATHRLTITLRNDPQGPIYGYPTYRDYVRIYVPPQARYISGSGFDQLTPMCSVAPPTPPEPTPTPGPSPTPTPTAVASPTPTPTSSPQSGSLPPIVGAALMVNSTPPPQVLPQCSATPYASGDRACPAQAYSPPNGAAFTVLASGNATVPMLDTLGAPPNRKSDLVGRAMWGGYVIIPAACTATIHLRWYVPGVVRA